MKLFLHHPKLMLRNICFIFTKMQSRTAESKRGHLYFVLFEIMQNTQPNKSTHPLFIIENGDYARMMCFIINK